jgi:hypothetical protein
MRMLRSAALLFHEVACKHYSISCFHIEQEKESLLLAAVASTRFFLQNVGWCVLVLSFTDVTGRDQIAMHICFVGVSRSELLATTTQS